MSLSLLLSDRLIEQCFHVSMLGIFFLQQNGRSLTQLLKIQWSIPNIAVFFFHLPHRLSSLAANFLVLGQRGNGSLSNC